MTALPTPTTTPATTLSQPANAYLRTRVMTASREELRLMLLEGAIKFARQGREGVATAQHEQAFTGLSQSREIILELMTTIRPEPNAELAVNVRSLYAFLYQSLVEGSFEKNVEKIDKVIGLLEFERETWVMVMQKLAEERGAHPAEAAQGVSIAG